MNIYDVAVVLGTQAANEIKKNMPTITLKPGRVEVKTPQGELSVSLPNTQVRSSSSRR